MRKRPRGNFTILHLENRQKREKRQIRQSRQKRQNGQKRTKRTDGTLDSWTHDNCWRFIFKIHLQNRSLNRWSRRHVREKNVSSLNHFSINQTPGFISWLFGHMTWTLSEGFSAAFPSETPMRPFRVPWWGHSWNPAMSGQSDSRIAATWEFWQGCLMWFSSLPIISSQSRQDLEVCKRHRNNDRIWVYVKTTQKNILALEIDINTSTWRCSSSKKAFQRWFGSLAARQILGCPMVVSGRWMQAWWEHVLPRCLADWKDFEEVGWPTSTRIVIDTIFVEQDWLNTYCKLLDWIYWRSVYKIACSMILNKFFARS